MLRPQKTKQE